MTNLEKASFILTSEGNTNVEEVAGLLYIDIERGRSVAIHPLEIEYLAEQYDTKNQ